MRLSVVLATFNEEENIGECLKSVINWSDEIVIVDGNSTDRTVEIAKKMGAKVYMTDNPTIFHINKQKAIDLAKGKWIFQLDADERVSDKLKKEIDEKISQAAIDGYWIPRKNYFLGTFLTKGGQYPDYTLRIYRNGKGKLPAVDVHEQAVVQGEVGYLTQPLIHMADITFSRYLLRYHRYTDLFALQLAERKVKPTVVTALDYLFLKPVWWFLLTYIRYMGFVDSWQGLLFSIASSLRYPVSYIKYLKKI